MVMGLEEMRAALENNVVAAVLARIPRPRASILSSENVELSQTGGENVDGGVEGTLTFPESADARLDPTASSLYLSMVFGGESDDSERPRIEGLLLAPLRNKFVPDSRWFACRDGTVWEGVNPNPLQGMATKRAIRTDAFNILLPG